MSKVKSRWPRFPSIMLISFGLLATLLPLMPGEVPRAAADAGGFLLTKPVYGANEAIVIELGTLDRGCDFIETASDIYIVPRGSAVPGASLAGLDPSGLPNTIQSFLLGGGIFDETIGFTIPSGTIPAGDWDVVEDVCQDGFFDAGVDSVLSPGFTVVIPANIPPVDPAIADAKADAHEEAERWEHASQGMEALFLLHTAHEILEVFECFAGELASCAGVFLAAMEQPALHRVEEAIKKTLLNTVSHYQGLAADPPDPNFQHPVELGLVSPVTSLSPLATLQASAELGDVSALTDALTLALLQSLERYQGARAASNVAWALRHARGIKTYALLLAASLPRQSDAALALRTEVNASAIDFDTLSTKLVTLQNDTKTNGFAPAEIAALKNLGLSDGQINDLLGAWNTLPLVFTRADFGTTMQGIATDNATLAAHLGALASAMDSIIATLESQITLSDPVAEPGGPYTGTARTPIGFDGSTSTNGGLPPLSFAWDLDGNGDFADGTTGTPTFTYQGAFHGLIGLRVTNNGGFTNTAYAHVDITDPNRPPVIDSFLPVATSFGMKPGETVGFEVTASDPDLDPVTVNWFVDTINVTSGPTFDFTPAQPDAGHRVIRAEVSDNKGAMVEQRWGVNVFLPSGPVGTLDHFLCYKAAKAKAPAGVPPFPVFAPRMVTIQDQFAGPLKYDLTKGVELCNPANKNNEDASAPSHLPHLEGYHAKLAVTKPAQPKFVKSVHTVQNQFGTLKLSLTAVDRLFVPSAKVPGTGGAPPLAETIDHLMCYKASVAKAPKGQPPFPTFTPRTVPVTDQFGGPTQYDLKKPTRLCAPANKNDEDPTAPSHATHLVCYQAALTKAHPAQPKFSKTTVSTNNQFGDEVLNVTAVQELCVPSEKLD